MRISGEPPNQLAKSIIDIATGQKPGPQPQRQKNTCNSLWRV
jgi:hypothetical protein